MKRPFEKAILIAMFAGIATLAVGCGNNSNPVPPPPPPGAPAPGYPGYPSYPGTPGGAQTLPSTNLGFGAGAFQLNSINLQSGAGPLVVREFLFTAPVPSWIVIASNRNIVNNCRQVGTPYVVYELISSFGEVLRVAEQQQVQLDPDNFRLRVTYNNPGYCDSVLFDFGANLWNQ